MMILQTEEDLKDIRTNRKEYTKICQMANKELLFCLEDDDNYPIYRLDIGSTKFIYALNHMHGAIEGFIQYEIEYATLLNIHWITNITSWRVGSGCFAGLTSKLVFENLLPLHGTITSDIEITERGKVLWDKLTRNAFDDELNIYLINFETKNIIQLEKLEDFQDICKQLKPWRDSNFGKYYRFAISEFDYPLLTLFKRN